jgi:hypothetical protein
MPNEISTLLGSCQEFECIVAVDIRNRVGSGRKNDSRVTDNVTIQGHYVGLIADGSLGLLGDCSYLQLPCKEILFSVVAIIS